ncbi:MAG: PIN domain-containing protein [Sporichthyaceae bacterium]
MARREAAARGGLTLDAGALIGIERGSEHMIALLRVARREGLAVAVPAGALAQVWRDGTRQARLAGFLRVRTNPPTLVALDGAVARAAGELCGRAGSADVVDASVVLCARSRHDRIVTGEPDDLRQFDPGVPLIVV